VNSEELHDFYAAVGRFAVKWATLESELDLLILKTRFHQAPADRPAREQHQLSAKIHRARDQFNCLPALAPMRSGIDSLLDEIERLSPTRHDVVHGAVFEGPSSFLLASLLQPKGPRRPARRVTTKEVEELADEVWALAGRLLDLLEALPKGRYA
jgi:hypothetical protein